MSAPARQGRPGRARGSRPAALIAAFLAAALGAALLSTFLAVPVLAATTFGTPTAASTWGEGVTFSQPVVLSGAPSRVEVVVTSTRDSGAFVSELPAQSAGATDLTYTVATGTDGILPNTPFTARWRVTYPDGTVDLGPAASTTYADTRFTWKTLSGPIVRVHWYAGDEAFGRRALKIGADAIAKAATLLGVTETEPVDFFVYADQAAFYDALGPGTRENVGGQANAEIRTLFALITPAEINDSWVGTVIPHELTHLVFDTAVNNPYHYPPRWLNEGLAVYLSQGYDASDRAQVRDAAGGGTLMPLAALGGEFPTTLDRFSLAYAESVSAVDFLVRTHGQEALVGLVRSYADGRTDDEAFSAALGTDLAGFHAAWLADLGAATPQVYGPRPAASGPLPADWSGAAPTAGSGPAAQGSGGGSSPGIAATPGTPASEAQPGMGDLPAGLAVAAALVLGVGTFWMLGRRRRRVAEPVVAGSSPGSDGGGAPGSLGAAGEGLGVSRDDRADAAPPDGPPDPP